MKERPILFSAPMVRAILDGSKTQTRRAFNARTVKLLEAAASIGEVSWFMQAGHMSGYDLSYITQFCPYGQPGDRLWVRETFGHFECNNELKPGAEIFYRADGEFHELEPWRPSIHMPRWACRIELEITGVRVERLQDISEADGQAEGVTSAACLECDGWANAYSKLWESINGPGSWDANPWVWVVEFRRIKP